VFSAELQCFPRVNSVSCGATLLLLENLRCCTSGVLKNCSGTGSNMFETHAATVMREERIHAPCLQSSERAACLPIELVSEINA
jgi:hypothetical protein